MRISDWSSDVCSSDLGGEAGRPGLLHDLEAGPAADEEGEVGGGQRAVEEQPAHHLVDGVVAADVLARDLRLTGAVDGGCRVHGSGGVEERLLGTDRSEEHTSELQSLMRISDAVFCLQHKNNKT